MGFCMKSIKLTIFALCAGFSAYAGEPTDNTPPTAKSRDWQSLPAGPAMIGGGYGLYKQHQNAIKNYFDMNVARSMENDRTRESGLYYKNRGRMIPAENYITANPPKMPPLKVPLMGGALMGYGLYTLARWYNSNVVRPYYPTKR